MPLRYKPRNKNSFWSYQSAWEVPQQPPEGSSLTIEQWNQFTPGMKREIHREADRQIVKNKLKL